MNRTLFNGLEGLIAKYMIGSLSADFIPRLISHCTAHDSYKMNMKGALGEDNQVRYSTKDLRDGNTYLRMGVWVFPRIEGVFTHNFSSVLRLMKRFDKEGRSVYTRYDYLTFPYRADHMTFDDEWYSKGSLLLSVDDLLKPLDVEDFSLTDLNGAKSMIILDNLLKNNEKD